MVKRLVANVAQPLVLPEGVFCVGVSIGLAAGQSGTDVEALLAQADGEMSRRKSWRVAARHRARVDA
jgi:GGDEF domain-containing protein